MKGRPDIEPLGPRGRKPFKEEYPMPATVPDHLCRLFQQAMAAGDIEAVLNLYDPDAVFVNAAGTIIKGSHGLRQALALWRPRRRASISSSNRSSRPGTSP